MGHRLVQILFCSNLDHLPAQCWSAAVARRLIERAIAARCIGESLDVRRLGHLEGVEARADEEQDRVAQHLPGAAKLAALAIALAQEPRLAVGAAVLEL